MMVYVNLVLGAVIIGFFFVGRKTAKPTKLNMKAKSNGGPLVLEPEKQNPLPSQKTAVVVSDTDRSLTKRDPSIAAAPAETTQRPGEERALGVLFMYNGHDWEAHQVLGLPQGASMHQITVTYQELIKKSDPSTFEFFEAAYTALSQKHKKHRL